MDKKQFAEKIKNILINSSTSIQNIETDTNNLNTITSQNLDELSIEELNKKLNIQKKNIEEISQEKNNLKKQLINISKKYKDVKDFKLSNF